MNNLKYPTVFFLAPPFLSHFSPMMGLAQALKELGTKVYVGTDEVFQQEVQELGLEFVPIQINKNANKGVAVESQKNQDELRRLEEFLNATKKGPVDTLITQGRHRTADMFANPEQVIESIGKIHIDLEPSLWVVDQLSYSVTLALYGLGLPFVSFCPPHPKTIPSKENLYGMPPSWPAVMEPGSTDLARLESVAQEVDLGFTTQFNHYLEEFFHRPPVESAFKLTSSTAIFFNYPPFPNLAREGAIFLGHTVKDQPLPKEYNAYVKQPGPKVLIALGTFLSSRDDVLNQLISLVLKLMPNSTIFVGGGSKAEELQKGYGEQVLVSKFIPQRALLPHVQLAFHHGGVSSFTESLYYGVPMVVLPFSSDQFNVAKDVETWHLGAICDPNKISEKNLSEALEKINHSDTLDAISHWSKTLKGLGPRFAAKELQEGKVS